jgi:SSU ribosomal protein S12P methylthiotransferase (EC 2.-.-.-)
VQESVQNILQAAADIEILPREKRPLLAVAGCLPARYGVDELAKELPEVDIWLNLSEIDSWAEMIKNGS